VTGRLQGRIAVVTGASRRAGIGAAICRKLAAEGADVFFTYWKAYDRTMPWGVSDEEPEELKRELLAMGVRAEGLEADLARTEAVKEILDAVEEKLGKASILVNNATYSTRGSYEELTLEELDRHIAINVRATTMLAVEFAKRYPGGPGGRIINMSSGQSQPMPGEIAYATTKGAVDALTISLSAEVAPKGITVNAVDPGPTNTGWMTEDIQKELLPLFPFGRIGRPEDAARLVAFLASDEAEWITGQVLHSRGGFR
jgi:3-oxoacyl-[acyl-carrier protein] reductase